MFDVFETDMFSAPFSDDGPATIGFKCASVEQVQQFHDTTVAAGGISIEDPPGPRTAFTGVTYLVYVRDPGGNKLCAICRPK